MNFILGTHNSCTFGTPLSCFTYAAIPWLRNQSLTIEQQLELGVRWFDLRLSYYNEDVYLSHTFIMNHTLDSIMKSFTEYQNLSHPIIIQMRVDWKSLSDLATIQHLTDGVLEKYSDYFLVVSGVPDIFSATTPNKRNILLYSSDGTIRNPYTVQKDIMPTVSLWNANSITACESILKNLENEFDSIQKNSAKYIFPDKRMIIFDYSSYLPLSITDAQQLTLLQKYADTIKKANICILAGNFIQTIHDTFTQLNNAPIPEM
jgi:hypothetical protein